MIEKPLDQSECKILSATISDNELRYEVEPFYVIKGTNLPRHLKWMR